MVKGLCYALLLLILQGCKPTAPVEDLVIDRAGLLSPEEAAELNQILNEYKQESNVEFIFYSTESLNAVHIDEFSARIVDQIGIGQHGLNNGLLILIAKQESSIRIWTQHGIEWQVTDSVATIIKDEMITYLDKAQFYEALQAGFEMLYNSVSPHSWQVDYHTLNQALAADEPEGKILTLADYRLPGSISLNTISGVQFDQTFKTKIYSIEGDPADLYYSGYMERLVENILNNEADTIYTRIRSIKAPIELELLGIVRKPA